MTFNLKRNRSVERRRGAELLALASGCPTYEQTQEADRQRWLRTPGVLEAYVAGCTPAERGRLLQLLNGHAEESNHG